MNKTSQRLMFAVLVMSLLAMASAASAQTGVSDDRVSLPEGPGSLEGVGENVEMDPNMGSMTYRVSVEVPSGFAGVTPGLDLSYNSGGSASVVGMGWSMSMPCIERMTYRGLPEYDGDDDFAADGGMQLVRLPGTNPPVYRARYEKGFVRYTWLEAGDGSEGYWLAEYPDGSKAYFGADADGNTETDAREGSVEGTFRYHLVEKVDVYGHRMVYQYERSGKKSYVSQISYVFGDDDTPTYQVRFDYEDRSDETGQDYVSDGAPGFELVLEQRLSQINVISRGVRIRRYLLTYSPYADSDGFTRLAKVERFGLEDGRYPAFFSFEYSQGLGIECDENDGCQRPYMVEMGTINANFTSGQATLLDINGDALPDILDTSQDGDHRFFINVANEDGSSAFVTTPVFSSVGTKSSHDLRVAGVQVLDINGDGFTDLVNAGNANVLINKGNGDWEQLGSVPGVSELAEALADDFDGEDGELQSLRFIDFDNDKLIDVMRSTQEDTSFFKNEGSAGFESVTGTSIGAGFAEDNLQLADINGDGLLDAVKLQIGVLSYRLNLGRGKWAGWVDVTGIPVNDLAELALTSLDDINGDARADLVVVSGNEVTYSLNRNGQSFGRPVTIINDDLTGVIPIRDSTTQVFFADMNANGSSDVVWIQQDGEVQYLELFPVRPGLITRVTNNLGMETQVEYSTSAVMMAQDGGSESWEYRLPYPMNVVSQVTRTDALTNLREVTQYKYKNGFYDGVEKQFRGFEEVRMRLVSDDSQEEGVTVMRFNVGADDPYFSSLPLSTEVSSGGRVLSETLNSYEDCPVAEVPGNTDLPVRHICSTQTTTTLKEGQDAPQWVVTEMLSQYDGYGNITLYSELGVTSVGGGSCEPCERGDEVFGKACGAQCRGDEEYTETEFIEPGENTNGRWMLNLPFRVRSYGAPGADFTSESLVYYDGNDFEGLPLGFSDQGKLTRQTDKVSPDSADVIQTTRVRFDNHGNIIEAIDPNGSIDNTTTYRRVYEIEDDGLRIVRAEFLLEDAEGQPYRLRRDVQYEDIFDKMTSATAWMRVVGNSVVSTRRAWSYTYDEFGRISERFLPGNTTDAPDIVNIYDLQSPASRIITRQRSQIGGELDLEMIRCFDGRNRMFQTRTRLDDDSYQVTGLSLFNVRSEPVEVFQPYTASGAGADECDTAAPAGTLSTTYRYDAQHRPIEVIAADGDIYGSASVNHSVYTPLATTVFDGEDNDRNSAHFNTPTTSRTDGMGRVVAIERVLEAGGEPSVIKAHFDGLGNMTGYTDAQGNTKEQFFDLVGRVTRVIDPNSADEVTFEYDDADNIVRQTDDRGIVTVNQYDGMNRKVVSFDQADEDGTRIEWLYDFDPNCDSTKCANAEGQVVSVSYPGLNGQRATDYNGFDLRSRRVYDARQIGGVTFEASASYDNANRVLSMTYPDGQVIEQAYDQASRLIEVPGLLHTMVYDERNQLESMGCADGTSTTFGYDDLMRLERKTIGGADGMIQGQVYQRDRRGNTVAIEDIAPSAPGRPSFAGEYQYDAWYRMTQAAIGQGGDRQEELNVGFDQLDNIRSKTSDLGSDSAAHVGQYSYDSFAPNAVTDVPGVSFDYDAAGNVEQRGEVTYAWDFMNRMTAAQRDGQDIGSYLYGADQSRVAKTEDGSTVLYIRDTFEVRDGISTTYIKVADSRMVRIESDALATTVLSDLDEDGQINAGDAWLSHKDGEGSGAEALAWSSVRRLLMETGPEEGTTFLHHDGLGNVTLATGMVDGQQEILGHRAFYPLGQERPDGSGYVDEYGFTGQEIDRATGLVHFDWRYYDPVVGRWLSIDPLFAISNSGSLGRLGESTTAYAYVAGGFMDHDDPTGLGKGDKKGGRRSSMSQGNLLKKANDKKRKKAKAQLKRSKTRNIKVIKKKHKKQRKKIDKYEEKFFSVKGFMSRIKGNKTDAWNKNQSEEKVTLERIEVDYGQSQETIDKFMNDPNNAQVVEVISSLQPNTVKTTVKTLMSDDGDVELTMSGSGAQPQRADDVELSEASNLGTWW